MQNPNDPIQIPTFLKSNEVDYECELAILIGKRCKNVSRGDALKYVLDYTWPTMFPRAIGKSSGSLT